MKADSAGRRLRGDAATRTPDVASRIGGTLGDGKTSPRGGTDQRRRPQPAGEGGPSGREAASRHCIDDRLAQGPGAGGRRGRAWPSGSGPWPRSRLATRGGRSGRTPGRRAARRRPGRPPRPSRARTRISPSSSTTSKSSRQSLINWAAAPATSGLPTSAVASSRSRRADLVGPLQLGRLPLAGGDLSRVGGLARLQRLGEVLPIGGRARRAGADGRPPRPSPSARRARPARSVTNSSASGPPPDSASGALRIWQSRMVAPGDQESRGGRRGRGRTGSPPSRPRR